MYSVVTYAGNSALNYNLDYNSLLYLGYCKPGLLLQNFSKVCTETCWLHCNTKSLAHQGRSKWFMLADLRANLARPCSNTPSKFRIYTSALLNEINNK